MFLTVVLSTSLLGSHGIVALYIGNVKYSLLKSVRYWAAVFSGKDTLLRGKDSVRKYRLANIMRKRK